MLVPAAGAFAAGTVTVIPLGEGSGEVESNSAEFVPGIPPVECEYNGESEEATGECGPVEMSPFGEGAAIELFQHAAQGSEFVEWALEGTGGFFCEGATEKCIPLEAEEGEEVEAFVFAVFEPCAEGSEAESCEEAAPEQTLTLNINEGEGTVVSDPAGLECTGSEGETCEASFEEGAEVTLTASPAAGYRTFNWQTCPSGNSGTRQCTVTMDEAHEVGVKFRKAWNLDLSKTGDGVGTIKNTSNGLTCATTCSEANQFLFEGQEITVYANAPGKNQFVEFTGGTGPAAACDGELECTYTVEADASTEAVINKYAQATLSLEKAGGGEAKITGGLFCNNSCTSISGDFYTGPTPEEVTLNWDLKNGTSSIDFGSGAGSCSGEFAEDTGSCTVTMDEAHELVATLE
jgi:hypothetical protein